MSLLMEPAVQLSDGDLLGLAEERGEGGPSLGCASLRDLVRLPDCMSSLTTSGTGD
jgi:hypothetical protein